MRTVRTQHNTAAEMASVSKIGKMERDPNLHYVKVEKETNTRSDYISPIDQMEDDGYTIVSEDKSVTGSAKMVLMAIPKDVHDAREKERIQQDLTARYAKSGDVYSEGGEMTTSGAMTINQLTASIQQPQDA